MLTQMEYMEFHIIERAFSINKWDRMMLLMLLFIDGHCCLINMAMELLKTILVAKHNKYFARKSWTKTIR